MKSDLQKLIQTQGIVYGAQMTMLGLFGGVVYYLIKSGSLGEANYDLALTFQTIILIVIPLSLGVAYFAFKSMVSKIGSGLTLEQKLRKYFTLVLIRSAVLELPGMFCCVAALVTVDELFLAGVPAILLVFALTRPSLANITVDLQLKPAETKQLES
jgi:hypothetical protein